tara:strand:- start:6447 stop:7715 length:1269 start_codon:yes stop_codon:yes gene_type:complete
MNKVFSLENVTLNITDGKHGDCINEHDSGFYFISVKDLEPYKINYKKARQITEKEFIETHKRTKLEVGDILIANSGNTIGKMLFIKDSPNVSKTTFQKSVAVIKPNTSLINGNFLFYNLLANVNGLRKAAVGSAQPNLLLRDLRSFKIDVNESLKNQFNIAKVLSDLDSKIETNNKINQELEAMAKTLYDYWFVQFDFPDKNGKPYKSSGGLMVFNEELKREIPVGWEVKELGDISEIKRGKLVTAKTANLEGKFKVVSAGISYSYFHSKSNRTENTITVSGSGANAGFINFWREPIFANDCTTVRGKTDNETLIILEFLRMRQNYIFQQARGSAQPHVYPKDISILKIAVPNNELFNEFGKKILPSNDLISNNLKQNQKLSELRDWLLPMLMNGQVSVGYAEQEVESLGLVAEENTKYEKG